MLFLIQICLIYSSSKVQSATSEITESKETKENPIRSLSFEKRSESNIAIIALGRDTSKNNVNLMKSSTPDDPNSYVIARDLSGDIKKSAGRKWKIDLDDVEPGDKDDVFSIQIREGNNIFQTEAFYYDKGTGKFKLLREKPESTFFTTENVVYICIAALAVIVGLVIAYVMCFKKSTL
ncbi:hypothetical protein GVAV_003081 [Gurleya vavrai]